jgi:predicted transcriptional regulator
MKIKDVVEIISGEILCGTNHMDMEVEYGFSSDMMSDVLTLLEEEILLITGLANSQAIRTAVMSDIKNIIIARGKVVTDDMIELANDSDIAIIVSPFSIYKISGLLYNKQLKSIY